MPKLELLRGGVFCEGVVLYLAGGRLVAPLILPGLVCVPKLPGREVALPIPPGRL